MTNLNWFKSNSIDIIFSIAAFHHLYNNKDRNTHLKEIYRVLKPWWLLLMTNWNLFQKKYIKCFFRNFFQKKSWKDTFVQFKSWPKVLSDRYYHAFTTWELHKLINKSWLNIHKEFFMKRSTLIKWQIWSFNICHVLKKLV